MHGYVHGCTHTCLGTCTHARMNAWKQAHSAPHTANGLPGLAPLPTTGGPPCSPGPRPPPRGPLPPPGALCRGSKTSRPCGVLTFISSSSALTPPHQACIHPSPSLSLPPSPSLSVPPHLSPSPPLSLFPSGPPPLHSQWLHSWTDRYKLSSAPSSSLWLTSPSLTHSP